MARESCADHDPGGVPTATDEAVAPATQQAEVLAGEDTTDAPEPAQPSPPADANQETDAETVAGHEGDTDSLSDPVVVAEVASAPVSADPVVVSALEGVSPAAVAGELPPVADPPSNAPGPGEPEAGEGASVVLVDGAALDELILPSAIQELTPLPDGSAIGPEGRLQIERTLDRRGRLNRYLASWRGDDGAAVAVELREAPADAPDLRREAEVLAEVRYAMLPAPLASFEEEGRRYLALDRREGETLAEALAAGLTPERATSIVLQLAQVLRRLHGAGWALLGLHPADVILGNPLRLAHLGTAARIGQEDERALHVAGHTAPEVAHRAAVTGKEDVYTLGTLLYAVLAGSPVPEHGPELAALPALVRAPGGPQLLRSALAPAEERADLETFYRHLLAFKRQLAVESLALQIVSGTTVGLNPTRLANEDACTYMTWSLTHHERSAQRSVLCVVDGMGGMEAGEVASRAAVRAVLENIPAGVALGGAEPPDPVPLVQAAARSVFAAAQGRAVGATITLVVINDGVLTLAHVGDTRAYLLREGVLTQLTHDHSLVAAMVASGVLTEEEARGHPDSNKVLRSLGSHQELPEEYIDTLTATSPDATLQLRGGDRLLLCSDGVWGVLDDDTLVQIMLESADDPTAVRTIIRRVLEGGAPDNATLIIARCDRAPAI